MTQAWFDAEGARRRQESIELQARHGLVRAGRCKVSPGAGQSKARRIVDELRQRRRLVRRGAETSHAGVDLQVHWNDLVAVAESAREVEARHADAEAAGSGRGRLVRDEAAHDQDAFHVGQAGELARLFQGGHRKPRGAATKRCPRDRHRAVTVSVRLHDGHQPGPRRHVGKDAGCICTHRAQVDVRPAKSAQRPPWRSACITEGSSGSRSLASSPASPRRCEMRRPAAAWR